MGQDGNIVQFKIKKHTALKKLMSTYCERAGLAIQVYAVCPNECCGSGSKFCWIRSRGKIADEAAPATQNRGKIIILVESKVLAYFL